MKAKSTAIGLIGLVCAISVFCLQSADEMQKPEAPRRKHSGPAALWEQKRAELKALIKSTADKQDMLNMKEALADIKNIEKQAGITDLQKQIGNLRVEACLIQQQEPIKGYLNKIKGLVEDIKKSTQAERKVMDDMMMRLTAPSARANNTGTADFMTPNMRRSPDGEAAPSFQQAARPNQESGQESGKDQSLLKDRIATLEDIMRDKSADQLAQIDDLNEKIYQATMHLIDQARPLAKQLEQKYGMIRESLKPFDESLAKAIGNINARLKARAPEIEKLKNEIRAARDALLKTDPCFAARDSMRESTWEAFFV